MIADILKQGVTLWKWCMGGVNTAKTENRLSVQGLFLATMESGTKSTTAPTAAQRWMVMGMADKAVDWFAEANRYAVLLMEQAAKAEKVTDKPLERKIIANGAILADLVQVVRCKDCKYYMENPWGEVADDMVCKFWIDWIYPAPNDFCSYGERRTDDAEN